MAHHDIVVIGASAGGVEALTRLVRDLPPGLPASLFVVCHFPSGHRSVLPEILSRSGSLLATHAIDGELFHPGHIYVAPPDYHLLLAAERRIQLTRGPRENHHRPAIDPLFRSAARIYGARVIGVVLTGFLNDGAAGLLAVRSVGGIAVVQDPADARGATMPETAARIAGTDYCVTLDRLAPLLEELIQQPPAAPGGPSMTDAFEMMPEIVNADMNEQVRNGRRGRVSLFNCPDCGGTLWQVAEDKLLQFRCHVGHVYQGETLLHDQADLLETALWTAVRIFKERHLLARQLAQQEASRGDVASAARFQEQADQAGRYGDLIRQYILSNPPPPQSEGEEQKKK
jgi:two-component system, chemotaxis family, protein-glutamate methylesterase/glutaminase